MKQNGPWKIKSSEVKYKNPWMSVREDQVIQPNGIDGIFGVVSIVRGVSVLALNQIGNVLLTKEFKYATCRMTTESISGAIEAGEEPLSAAKRELREEAGMTAKTWISLGQVDPFTNYLDSPVQLFLARDLEFVGHDRDATEAATLKIIETPFENAVEMVMNSEITHAQSCVLILKAAKYLGKLV